MGPNKIQRLHKTADTEDTIKLTYTEGDPTTLRPTEIASSTGQYNTMSLKASVLMQSSSGKVNATVQTYNSETDQMDISYPCKIKLFMEEAVKDYNGTALNIGNFGNGLCTKISLAKLDDGQTAQKPFTSLNLIIPANYFGIIMFYYIKTNATDSAPIISTTENCLARYNIDTGEAGKITLAEGVNIIKISESCALNISSGSGILIFSSLDIIPTGEKGINPKLAYRQIDKKSIDEQILADIKKLDPNNKFYYNAPMNNETLIDLNSEDQSDTLADPHA